MRTYSISSLKYAPTIVHANNKDDALNQYAHLYGFDSCAEFVNDCTDQYGMLIGPMSCIDIKCISEVVH